MTIVNRNTKYPFGMLIESRKHLAFGGDYAFGFNGKMVDKEVKGEGNSLDFGARIYDPRLGRWMSIDPKFRNYQDLSPYNFSENSPIVIIDQDGKFSINVHDKITSNALSKYGYNELTSDLLGHYASVYADHPSFAIQLFQRNFKRSGIDYNDTKNSQNTASGKESRRHSMSGDFENIGEFEALRKGQAFGWNKVFEAAKEGTPDGYKVNSKGAKAFGVGIHALQDAKIHIGVKFKDHDHLGDLGGNAAENHAVGATESAILVIEILNNKFDNLQSNMSLDVSGMSLDQRNTIEKQIMKAGVKNITLMDFTPEYRKKDTGTGKYNADASQGGSGKVIGQ